jgi:hypothetical protein
MFASVQAAVPRGSIVLVANRGDRDMLRLGHRAGWPFPQDEDGAWTGEGPSDSAAAIAHLEDLRAEGAGYLVIPDSALPWLDQFDGFRRHLEASYSMTRGEQDSCLIFALDPERPHGLAPTLNPQASSAG